MHLLDRFMGIFLGEQEPVEYRLVSVSWDKFAIVRADSFKEVYRGNLSECETWLDLAERQK